MTVYPKSASVSFNASYEDAAVDELTADYGDFLERMAIEEKLHLLAILATWQAADTDYVSNPDLCDRLDIVDSSEVYPCPITSDLYDLVRNLHDNDLSDKATFGLMVAIANQLVAEQRE